MTAKRKDSSLKRERTPFEWVVLVVSLAAIATIAAGLLAFGVGGRPGPARLKVTIDDPSAKAFLVTVSNIGGTTAEEVVVDVERGSESHEVAFRAVPKGDKEEAVVSLGGSADAKATVLSFKEP
ncbi:MAG: hypothetical protein WD826_12080 [Actinomycetota bacterium]